MLVKGSCPTKSLKNTAVLHNSVSGLVWLGYYLSGIWEMIYSVNANVNLTTNPNL